MHGHAAISPKKPPTASRSANFRRLRTLRRPTRRRSSEVALHRAHPVRRLHERRRNELTYVVEGREALTPIFEDLKQYDATTHFNGQSTITLDGDRATGESYTIAHHLFSTDGERKIRSQRSATSTPSPKWMERGCSPSVNSSSTGATRPSQP